VLDKLGERLLDANQTIGQPNKIAMIFGRKVTKHYRGKLQTEIEVCPRPPDPAHRRASNNVNDYKVNKAAPTSRLCATQCRPPTTTTSTCNKTSWRLSLIAPNCANLQNPTMTASGKRIPGLNLNHPRQLALMHALVRFAQVAAGNRFTTAKIHPYVIAALGCHPDAYKLASLRYDLSQPRAKGLIAKLPCSRRYQLLPRGYSYLPHLPETLRARMRR
jgi:hypothetical protein